MFLLVFILTRPCNKCYSDKCPLEKCHTRDLIYPQKKSFSYKVSTMNSHDTMSSSSRASETWARVKITPPEKRLHAGAWGDFHARSRFARSNIPEGKWGTTRSLSFHLHRFPCWYCLIMNSCLIMKLNFTRLSIILGEVPLLHIPVLGSSRYAKSGASFKILHHQFGVSLCTYSLHGVFYFRAATGVRRAGIPVHYHPHGYDYLPRTDIN